LNWQLQELESVFADIGPVRIARIVRDPLTGESKGYGFVRLYVVALKQFPRQAGTHFPLQCRCL
jgi:hypothetical protein